MTTPVDNTSANYGELRAAVNDLIAAGMRIAQAYDIARDHFEEIEVDDEMVDPYEVLAEFRAALSAAQIIAERTP